MISHSPKSNKIIDGRACASQLLADIKKSVTKLHEERGIIPGLAVVLVGNDPASEIYVRNKAQKTHQMGMRSFMHMLPATTSQEELLTLIDTLNRDPNIHGILIQLPLPKHIDKLTVINAIDASKDVDGLGEINAGRLSIGNPTFIPCTPLGCLILLKKYLGDLTGKHAVVIGASNLVGKPMGLLLLNEGCTVSMTHIHTRDITSITKLADILVVATGQAELVKGNWVKEGVTVLDVGITRVDMADGKKKLLGDVAFDEVEKKARFITPVPGGVGPMTIACLLRNTLTATYLQEKN